MTDRTAIIIICAVTAFLVPVLLYIIMKKKYHVTSGPFWAGVITFVVFALILEDLALDYMEGTAFWHNLLATPVLAAAVGGLVAGLFEEGGCLISMKISNLIEKRRKKEEHESSHGVTEHVQHSIHEAEHERNHALLHGLGHGGAVVFVFFVTMVLNLIYSFNSSISSVQVLSGTEVLAAAMTMQNFHRADFIFTLVEEIAALGIHISLAVMVWISMKGSWYVLFFPLSIILHAVSEILMEVLLEAGLSEIYCLIFFILISLVIVQFTLLVWHKIKFKKILQAVEEEDALI